MIEYGSPDLRLIKFRKARESGELDSLRFIGIEQADECIASLRKAGQAEQFDATETGRLRVVSIPRAIAGPGKSFCNGRLLFGQAASRSLQTLPECAEQS